MRGHRGYVWSLAFAPNGRFLVSGSGVFREKRGGKPGEGFGDGDVKVWDLATRKVRFSHYFPAGAVNCVAVSPDSRRLALCGPDATVRVWDSATATPLATLKGHTGRVCGVAFDGSGKRLASGGQDATVRVWDLPPPNEAGR